MNSSLLLCVFRSLLLFRSLATCPSSTFLLGVLAYMYILLSHSCQEDEDGEEKWTDRRKDELCNV